MNERKGEKKEVLDAWASDAPIGASAGLRRLTRPLQAHKTRTHLRYSSFLLFALPRSSSHLSSVSLSIKRGRRENGAGDGLPAREHRPVRPLSSGGEMGRGFGHLPSFCPPPLPLCLTEISSSRDGVRSLCCRCREPLPPERGRALLRSSCRCGGGRAHRIATGPCSFFPSSCLFTSIYLVHQRYAPSTSLSPALHLWCRMMWALDIGRGGASASARHEAREGSSLSSISAAHDLRLL